MTVRKEVREISSSKPATHHRNHDVNNDRIRRKSK